MASLIRRRWCDERGTEIIEFAVVLPLLLLILMGIIDFGLLLQRYMVVTNAAREGARVAVLPGYTESDVQLRVDQFLDAAGLTEGVTPASLGEQTINVGGEQCIVVRSVTVNYPYSYSAVGAVASVFDGTGFTRSGLQATATMRSELSAVGCS